MNSENWYVANKLLFKMTQPIQESKESSELPNGNNQRFILQYILLLLTISWLSNIWPKVGELLFLYVYFSTGFMAPL